MSNEIDIIVIGDTSVGKTAATLKFVDDVSLTSLNATIGVNFKTTILCIDGEDIQLNIWDTAGQEKYRSLTQSYFTKAQGIALFFDVTNRDSFNHLQSWINEIDEKIDLNATKIPIVICGNKIDLESKRVVSHDEASSFASGKYPYFETSALTGEGVREAFTKIAEQKMEDIIKNDKVINIDTIDETQHKNKNCC